jgi:hypothetical protein
MSNFDTHSRFAYTVIFTTPVMHNREFVVHRLYEIGERLYKIGVAFVIYRT